MKRIIPAVLAVGLAAAGHASAQTTSPPGGAAGTGTAGATGAPTTMGSPDNNMGTPGAGGPGAAGALTNPAMPPGAAATGTTMGTAGGAFSVPGGATTNSTRSPGTTGTDPAAPTAGTAGVGAPGAVAPAAVGTTAAPSRTPQAPVPGANSFSEGQVRARMEERGFGQITDLRKDDQGIWRGRAMREGRPVGVALDYQGNIVEQ